MSLVRRVLGAPARRLFDRRIEWLLNAMDERLGPADGPTLHQRLDRVEAMLARNELAAAEVTAGQALATLKPPGAGLAGLRPATAELLNWAEGPEGLAAQAGLWFNPPVPIRYVAGGAEVLLVNERIAEQPFVFAALAGLSGARIVDVGGAESTVALSLASLGHHVTLVDPRGYPVEHPNLEVLACRLDEVPAGRRFDAAVALSAVEHFGLGHYVDAVPGRRLDLEAVADLRGRAETLVLSVPVGPPSVDDFQRVYDAAGLDELLGGWTVTSRALVRRLDRTTWRVEDWSEPVPEGAALVTARR